MNPTTDGAPLHLFMHFSDCLKTCWCLDIEWGWWDTLGGITLELAPSQVPRIWMTCGVALQLRPGSGHTVDPARDTVEATSVGPPLWLQAPTARRKHPPTSRHLTKTLWAGDTSGARQIELQNVTRNLAANTKELCGWMMVHLSLQKIRKSEPSPVRTPRCPCRLKCSHRLCPQIMPPVTYREIFGSLMRWRRQFQHRHNVLGTQNLLQIQFPILHPRSMRDESRSHWQKILFVRAFVPALLQRVANHPPRS